MYDYSKKNRKTGNKGGKNDWRKVIIPKKSDLTGME